MPEPASVASSTPFAAEEDNASTHKNGHGTSVSSVYLREPHTSRLGVAVLRRTSELPESSLEEYHPAPTLCPSGREIPVPVGTKILIHSPCLLVVHRPEHHRPSWAAIAVGATTPVTMRGATRGRSDGGATPVTNRGRAGGIGSHASRSAALLPLSRRERGFRCARQCAGG